MRGTSILCLHKPSRWCGNFAMKFEHHQTRTITWSYLHSRKMTWEETPDLQCSFHYNPEKIMHRSCKHNILDTRIFWDFKMTELLMRNKFTSTAFRSIFMIKIAWITLCLMTSLSASNWTTYLMNMNRELTQAYIQKSKLTPTNWFLNCLETTYAYFIILPSGMSEVEDEEVKYFIRVYA